MKPYFIFFAQGRSGCAGLRSSNACQNCSFLSALLHLKVTVTTWGLGALEADGEQSSRSVRCPYVNS